MCTCVAAAQATAFAQVTETVGGRASGMGGAFVAVASDSSATWWNPAGLASGPFLDLALGRATVATPEVWRYRTSWFALGTPPLGVSYYRFRLTDIQPFDPTAAPPPGREDRGAGVAVRSLAASQLGVTLVQTIISGVHTGATLKYLRATPEGGETDQRFDLDLGVLATAGAVRVGARVRNVTEPTIGTARLERQTRVGLAIDAEAAGGAPLTVAIDVDVDAYATASGRRRMVAFGAEHWLGDRRLGLRGGGRINRAGARDRSATAGASVAIRAGMYVDGHVVGGGAADERGWGVAARVSF
jgi:hypothetical protein